MTYLRSLIGASALTLFALSAHAVDNCQRPASPDVPDVTGATEDVLMEAQNEVQEFVGEGQEYLACLQEREAELAGDISEEKQQELLDAFNSMVEEMQQVADDFNETVREWQEDQEA